MVAFLRRFLVMILVLLQFAAPLVHAHVDDFGRVHGLHLYEFESLHIKSGSSSLTASVDYVGSLQSAIVVLGEAIKIRPPLQEPVAFSVWQADSLLPKHTIAETINFSPHEELDVQAPFFFQHSSRAPPGSV